MGVASSIWASVQGDPVFMRRVNGWFTVNQAAETRERAEEDLPGAVAERVVAEIDEAPDAFVNGRHSRPGPLLSAPACAAHPSTPRKGSNPRDPTPSARRRHLHRRRHRPRDPDHPDHLPVPAVVARNPELLGAPGFEPMPVARRRFSGWTVVVPLTLTACVYVVASIIAGTRWTIGAGHGGPPAPTRVAHTYTTRSGDTWRSVARQAHLSARRLHALNPRDTARGSIVPGEHLLLRP